ncbi:MAG: DUF3667 domain-containing protein [Robiginitalea sp.]
MKCRNCNANLRTDFQYCPGCGAKLEPERITFKRLLGDLADRVFNLDNSFTRTFITLFKKPEKVVNGYISGVRKKFMNPLSYMGIALTLSGVIVFVISKFYADVIDFTGSQGELDSEFTKEISEIIYDYNAFFFLLYLPVLALPSYLLFNKMRYNYAEHIVVFFYLMAQYSLIAFPISVVTLLVSPEEYVSVNQPMVVLALVYSLYVLQRMNRFPALVFAGRTLLYFVLLFIFFFVLIMGLVAFFFITGIFEVEDFEPAAQATSSAINWASYNLL